MRCPGRRSTNHSSRATWMDRLRLRSSRFFVQPPAHLPPVPPIVDGDAVALHQRLKASEPRTACCSGWRTLSGPALDQSQLARYVEGSPTLTFLPFVQPPAHLPPVPPIVDGDAVARHQRLKASEPRTACCSGWRALSGPALDQSQLARYVDGLPTLVFLPFVQPPAHLPPVPPILDGDAPGTAHPH